MACASAKGRGTDDSERSRKALMPRRTATAYLFLAPALILMLIFTFYPVVIGIGLAFTKYNMISPPKFVGLQNFFRIAHDHKALIAMKNSLLYLLVVPVIQCLSILLALLVNREIRGISLFRALYYVPVITSIVVVALIWRSLLAPLGWLTNPRMALMGVMFVTLWKGLGYYMVIYLAGLQSIDKEYEEAAKLDGARKGQIFLYITLPLLKPSITLCTIISSIAALKVFAEIYVMTEGGPLLSTTTMVYYIYQTAFTRLDMGYSSALALFLALVIACLSGLHLSLFRRGGLEYY